MSLKEGKLPTAFQMAQVGIDKPRCFIIGGTYSDNDDPSTKWTREILIDKKEKAYIKKMKDTHFPRMCHALCVVSKQYIVTIGSIIKKDEAGS